MKKIMTPLSGQYDPENPAKLGTPALRTAFMVARAFDSHVEALSIVDPPAESIKQWPMWLPGGSMNAVFDAIDAASVARREHAKRQFEIALDELPAPPPQVETPAPGWSTRFVERAGSIRDVIAYHGRLCDLLVVGSGDMMWLEPFTPIIEACLTETGRPVLVSPEKPAERIGSRVAVAWDGTAPAARAVTASMPFLTRADEIHVVSCEQPRKKMPPLGSLAEFLAWHGLAAETRRVDAPSRDAGEELFDCALERGCDLMVLGARVHSRAHRLIFGSVTEYALDRPRMPVFFGP